VPARPQEAAAPKPRRTGLWVVWAGVACETLGFVLLGGGSDTAAPLLIVGSFAVMGAGIWIGWD
jgi:hypothetical protein